jgi:hypothetical protein
MTGEGSLEPLPAKSSNGRTPTLPTRPSWTRNAPGVRHLSRLPPLLQSLRFLPRLFDLIDNSPKEDVEHLASEDFKPVVEACTLCDMCFMTKCPYVPPQSVSWIFPHLMLRHRAAERAHDGQRISHRASSREMDRIGTLARVAAPGSSTGPRTNPTSRCGR